MKSERFDLAPGRIVDLDGLWEEIVGEELPMPLEIEFMNLGKGQDRRYSAPILLFEEAEEELEGQLLFNIK